MNWQDMQHNGVWCILNVITDETIEVFHQDKAERLAMCLSIRDMADYASIGEFEWIGVTSQSFHKHAILRPRNNPLEKDFTLCDRPVSGVSYRDILRPCPDCLQVITDINDGFVPEYDPYCKKFAQGKIDIAALYVRFNNLDYANHLKGLK